MDQEQKKQSITQTGYDELVAELDYLTNVKQPENSKKIQEVREQGDLSENAEYEAARDEQAKIVARIEEIKKILDNSEVIEKDNKNKTKVKLESVVTVIDTEFDEEVVYTIVGPSEVNALENKISDESPLGLVLMGKKKGDTVTVNAPSGEIEYKIVAVKN